MIKKALCLGFFIFAFEATAAQIDQDNWTGFAPTVYNTLAPLQQEFTPTLETLDTIQVMTGSGFAPSAFAGPAAVNILQGGVGGPIIAASSPVNLSAHVVETPIFQFSQAVRLIPGQRYAFQVIPLKDGAELLLGASASYAGDSYRRGRLYFGGEFVIGDLLFREGIGIVPEPASLALLAPGLAIMFVYSMRQKRVQKVAFLMLGGLLAAIQGQAAQVDQEYWPTEINFGANSSLRAIQEFTPQLDALDTIQISIGGGGAVGVNPYSASGFVTLRQGGIDGSVIAQSDLRYIPEMFSGTMAFSFPGRVTLIPGQLYAFELVGQNPGDYWGLAGRFPRPGEAGYSGGRFSFNGIIDIGGLRFREGIGLELVPESSPLALIAAGLGVILACRSGGRKP